MGEYKRKVGLGTIYGIAPERKEKEGGKCKKAAYIRMKAKSL